MTEKAKIKDDLKSLANDMSAILEALKDPSALTDDQVSQYEAEYQAHEKTAATLQADLAAIEGSEQIADRQQRIDAIRDAATKSTRATSPNQLSSNVTRQREAVADDPRRGFRNFAEYSMQVFDAGNNVRGDAKLMKIAAGTGFSQSVTSDGGVLVPPAFSKTIWDGVMQQSNSLLSMCDRYTVDPGQESVTVPAPNASSRADGSRNGGVLGAWKSELTQMVSSKMTFREVKFSPHELYVFCFISDKLLRNAPGMASQIMERAAADEISFKIGDAIFNGSGVGKPTGIVGHAATVSVAKETGQAAATITKTNIDSMWARCHSKWRSDSVWLINQDVEPALENLKVEVGTGGVPAFLPPGGVSEQPYARLKGRPVIPIEYCPTLGTVGDIVLCNLKAYAAAVKGAMNSDYSMHLKFDYAQTAYRIIFEIDGQPWLDSTITPYKGSNTLSPIVTLATRA